MGKFCHRCAQAETLEALLSSKQQYTPKATKLGLRKPWTFEEMSNEAKRLRGSTRSRKEAELSDPTF
jgi:hypothetical protein